MTARLILARHGNTFNPEDVPVMVGARTDLPLVEKGLMQAEALGEALSRSGLFPASITTGPLQRTRQMAEIIAKKLGISPESIRIDPRLTEIDYGMWEGKTDAEIAVMDKENEREAWDKQSIFPFTPHWQPCEEQVFANVELLLTEADEGTSLIVTSNGILRFFAGVAANADAFPKRKVATGNVCVMERDAHDQWRIVHWNESPEIFYKRGL